VQIVRTKTCPLSGHRVSAAHRHHPRTLTEMGLHDRDNLVRVAQALFYVGLLLAVFWMFALT
jgi:hypothetical protein